MLAAYVLVEVEHLLAGDGEEARKKALLHARAEHDRIPLLTKGGFPVVHCASMPGPPKERTVTRVSLPCDACRAVVTPRLSYAFQSQIL